MVWYYCIIFILSIICSGLYFLQWKKNYSILYTLTFVIITLANMGYLMLSLSHNLEEAVLANKITYLGGCYLLMMIMFYVCEMCHVKLKWWIKCVFVVLNTIFYLGVLSIGYFPYFYTNVAYTVEDGIVTLNKEYAPLHTLFYLSMIVEFIISFAVLIYARRNKPQASLKNIHLLFLSQTVSVFSFFFGRIIYDKIEWLPVAYVFDQIIYLIIASRTMLYDVSATAIASVIGQEDIGFVTFDSQFCYLGCNVTADRFLPNLSKQRVDIPIREEDKTLAFILTWLKAFRDNQDDHTHILESNGRFLQYEIGYLYDGKRKRGYSIMITDVTQQQRYTELLNHYNEDLKEEVEKKTERIQILQDRLVMGMATMVESRDNSTGGHIRRTSDVVKLLLDEIREDDIFGIDETFYHNMIKAAPMHDLGKIAVDDAVLRKPGRFTPEEFEKMKTHAAEGAKVVRKILADTDDENFKILAENVAHFHHERMDGSGYPEGLMGDAIPLEARIMAVADVYDALVSKRCYKERMSFEKAYSIIMESMGTHFDKRLEPYFVKAVGKMEQYYLSLESDETEE